MQGIALNKPTTVLITRLA